jgi:tetratricopeptide (TPR) repeat protein
MRSILATSRSSLALFALSVLAALTPGCFWGLSEEEEKALGFYRSQAQYWVGKQRFREVRQQAQRGLEIDPDDYELNRLMGYAMVMIGEPELFFGATDYLDKCASQNWFSSDWKLDLIYGLAYHRQAKHYQVAILDLREKAQSTADPVQKAEYAAKAKDFEAKMTERYDNAIRLFEGIASDKENYDVAVDNLAQIYANLGRWDEALAQSDILIRNAMQALKDEEAILLDKNLSPYQEEQRLDRIRRHKVRIAEMRGLRANIYFEIGRFADSVTELDEVLQRLDTSRYAEYFNRAEAKVALGDLDGAKADYLTFLRRSISRAEQSRVAEARSRLQELGVDVDKLIELDLERLRARSLPDVPAPGERG